MQGRAGKEQAAAHTEALSSLERVKLNPHRRSMIVAVN